jgi:hypothetical protein
MESNLPIWRVLFLMHLLISACHSGKTPETTPSLFSAMVYNKRADWEGMIPPSQPIPISYIECSKKTVTLPPGTLIHPKYKYLNINICRRVRPPYTDEDKREKLTL